MGPDHLRYVEPGCALVGTRRASQQPPRETHWSRHTRCSVSALWFLPLSQVGRWPRQRPAARHVFPPARAAAATRRILGWSPRSSLVFGCVSRHRIARFPQSVVVALRFRRVSRLLVFLLAFRRVTSLLVFLLGFRGFMVISQCFSAQIVCSTAICCPRRARSPRFFVGPGAQRHAQLEEETSLEWRRAQTARPLAFRTR